MRIFLIFVSFINMLFVPFASIMLMCGSCELADTITWVDKTYSILVLIQPFLLWVVDKYRFSKMRFMLAFLLVVYESVLVSHFHLIDFTGSFFYE